MSYDTLEYRCFKLIHLSYLIYIVSHIIYYKLIHLNLDYKSYTLVDSVSKSGQSWNFISKGLD